LSWERATPGCVNGSFTHRAENEIAGGTGPPAVQTEVRMQEHLILLLLFVAIFDVKVKIVIKKR
jgi:hypothetical protein